jgi:ATP-binding cassette subfamily G (WHITE) protein 1
MFMLLNNISFNDVLAVISGFFTEVQVFRREHFNGMYRADTYFLARQMVDLPVFMLQSLIVTSIMYWMVGLNPEPTRFLIACGTVLLISQTVLSVGYFLACAAPHIGAALVVVPVVIIPSLLLGGFFLNPEYAPPPPPPFLPSPPARCLSGLAG